MEQSHRVDVRQLRVDVRHGACDTDDGPLHEVQVGKQDEQQNRGRLFVLTRGGLMVETGGGALFIAVFDQ